MIYPLPNLPYEKTALEPYIDAKTMEVHYTKHHQTYLDKLNAALQSVPEIPEQSIESLLSNLDSLPESVRVSVKNNGGGYYHHSIFWEMMKPNGGGAPHGKIAEKIQGVFSSFENFEAKFKESALTAFGSAWTWLCKDRENTLSIVTTPNQDSPITQGFYPLLGIDLWEHAYYLHYQNRRAEYIEAFFHVIDWDTVEKRFLRKL